MAKNNEAKVKFTAETAEFNANIKTANAELGALRAELTLNATQMKATGETADGLAERQKLLSEQLKAAGDKTENLRQKLAVAEKYYGSNSDEALNLKKQVTAAATAEEKIKQQIEACNDKLEAQTTEAKDTSTAMDKLKDTIADQESALKDLKTAHANAVLQYGKNSNAATDLAGDISALSKDLADNKKKMADAESAADDLEAETKDAGEAAKEASDGFTVWKGTLANLISSGIQNAISGIGNLASSFWGLAEETREARTNMGKLETAFDTAGFSAGTASDTYTELYGVLGDDGQATEAAAHLAKLATTQDELSQWTTIATGVYATFGDSLPIEGLTEAANETAKVGQVTGPLADALNWATMSNEDWEKALGGNSKALKAFQKATKKGMSAEDAFNEALAKCSSEQERQQLITATLNGLYGESAAAYAETNAEIIEANEAQAKYNESLAGLGSFIEPLKTTFTNGMAGILESVTQMLEGIDMEALKQSVQDAFEYIETTVFPAIKEGIQWFIDNKDTVIGALTGIVAGIAAFKIVSVVQSAIGVFTSFTTAIKGGATAFQALNMVMGLNPIALVIAGIAALVAAFIYLWNNCEGFRNFWINLWNVVKAWCISAWQAICNWFSIAWEWVKGVWGSACEWFGGIWQGIKNFFAGVPGWFGEQFRTAWNNVKTAWSAVTGWFSGVWNGIKNAFAAVKSWFGNIFRTAWNNIKSAWSGVTGWFSSKWTAIKNTFASVGTWFKGKFQSAWTNVKNVFAGWGEFFGGLWTKIKNKFSDIGANMGSAIGDSVKAGINKVLGWVETTLNKAIGMINGAIDVVNKVPGVNIGKIQELSMPQLASGGVLRNATAFIGGEYQNAFRNPEIVTPQSIMRETFADTLSAFLPNANALYMDDLVGAIEDLANRAINMYIGDRQIAMATAGASDRVSGNRLKLKERGLAL